MLFRSSRRITIAANTKDRDVTSIVGEIQRRLDQRLGPLPTGYRIEFEGEHIARAKAQSELVLMGILSLVGVFILLFIDFQSVSLTLLIMLSVPLSIIGGIVAVLLSGGNLSLGSLVGFITLFGIAIRNGILMVSHLGRLDQATEASSGDAFILQAASERLSPILMTALCTGLALLPLVISGNLPGHEIEHPMAIVIVGGLISSTLMTLYFLPVAYRLLVRRK